jgi:hypothetical protein
MTTTNGIHWQTPAAMTGAVLASMFFALGHHLLYRSLGGKQVPSGSFDIAGFPISPQQVNIAAGTAFAFLVNSCLAAAIAIVYAQLMWNIALSKPVRLGSLDTASAGLNNIFQLLYLRSWRGFRSIFFLALVAW